MGAIFSKKRTVRINFDTKGGTPVPEVIECENGTTWGQIKGQVTQPTLTENTFKHWSLSDGGEPLSDEHIFTKDSTVFTVWEPFITVSFDTDGGVPTTDPKKVAVGTTWGQIRDEITSPAKDGHVFLGWEIKE